MAGYDLHTKQRFVEVILYDCKTQRETVPASDDSVRHTINLFSVALGTLYCRSSYQY